MADKNTPPTPAPPGENLVHDVILGDIKRGRRASYKILIPSGIYAFLCITLIAYAVFFEVNGALAVGALLLSQSGLISSVYVFLVVRFWLTEDEIVVSKKFINEKSARIPYDHIHGLSTTTSFTEKLLGLTSLDIETSSDKSLSNDRLRYIPVEEAQEIIDYVHAVQAKGYAGQSLKDEVVEAEASGGADAGQEEAFDFSDFSSIRVFLYSLLRLRIRKLLIAFYGLFLFFQNIADFFEDLGFAYVVNSYGESFNTAGPFETVRLVLLGLVILISVCLVGSVFIECIRIYGFKVTKKNHSIAVTRGLITESMSSIDLDRIYGVNVYQSIPQRVAGYASLNLYVMGDASHNDGYKDTVLGEVILHPCIQVDDIPAFLGVFVPEYAKAYAVEPQLYLSPQARGRIMRQTLYKYLLLLAALGAILWVTKTHLFADDLISMVAIATVLAVIAITTAIGMVLSLIWELKHTSYTMKDGFLAKKRVRLESTSDYFPRRSLEYASFSQTPWQIKPRLCDFASEVVGVAGFTINELSLEEGKAIMQWVRTGVEPK